MNPRYAASNNPELAPLVRLPLEQSPFSELGQAATMLERMIGGIGLQAERNPLGLVIVEAQELLGYPRPIAIAQLIQGHHLLSQTIDVDFDQATAETHAIDEAHAITTISFIASEDISEVRLKPDRAKVVEILKIQLDNEFTFRLPLVSVLHASDDSDTIINLRSIGAIYNEDLEVDAFTTHFGPLTLADPANSN